MRRLVALGAVLVLLLAACGDDGDEEDAGGGGAAQTTVAGGDDVAAYCEDSLAIETVPEPDIDFESLSQDQQKAAVKEFFATDLAPILARLKESVPTAIEEPAQVLFAAADKVAADGDFAAFETPAAMAAEDEVHAYDLANCGWTSVPVTATEYAFGGIPATLEAGPTSFDLTNNGQELHEVVVLRKKAGVTESFDQLLALDEEEARAKVDPVASTFAAQGESNYAVADLTAGDYLVACFIPVGTTSEDAEPAEDAPPHVARGMKAEFKVS